MRARTLSLKYFFRRVLGSKRPKVSVLSTFGTKKEDKGDETRELGREMQRAARREDGLSRRPTVETVRRPLWEERERDDDQAAVHRLPQQIDPAEKKRNPKGRPQCPCTSSLTSLPLRRECGAVVLSKAPDSSALESGGHTAPYHTKDRRCSQRFTRVEVCLPRTCPRTVFFLYGQRVVMQGSNTRQRASADCPLVCANMV